MWGHDEFLLPAHPGKLQPQHREAGCSRSTRINQHYITGRRALEIAGTNPVNRQPSRRAAACAARWRFLSELNVPVMFWAPYRTETKRRMSGRVRTDSRGRLSSRGGTAAGGAQVSPIRLRPEPLPIPQRRLPDRGRPYPCSCTDWGAGARSLLRSRCCTG
jgi:hypothetical protein